jgi:nucleotide-binding universal stress UspA family protein
MRSNGLKILALILLSVLFSGCWPQITVSSTSIGTVPDSLRAKNDTVRQELRIFFGNTEPAERFIQLAYLEVKGRETSDTEELLAKMKETALAKGANGIIGIRKTEKEEERPGDPGDMFRDKAERKPPVQYRIPVMTGVAVFIIKNQDR